MATNAERQRAFRARKRAEGLVACTVMVPDEQFAVLQMIAERMRANPNLTVSVLRDQLTGRLVKL